MQEQDSSHIVHVNEHDQDVPQQSTSVQSESSIHSTDSQPQPKKFIIKRHSKWFIPSLIIAVIAFLSASAYGYKGVYMQMPVNVWKQAVITSGAGLAQFLAKPAKTYNTAKLSGTVSVASPTTVNATINGELDSKNAAATVNVSAFGQKINLETRSIYVQKTGGSDVYLKVDGLKNITSLFGSTTSLGEISKKIDNQWYVVDSSLTSGLAPKLPTTSSSLGQVQTDAAEIVSSVGVVLKDKLFTVNQNKAVVVVKKNMGKEDFKGRKSIKYSAQVRKPQLKDMVVSLKDSLKNSKANNWLVGSSQQTFEQAINFDSLIKQIDAASENSLTAEVWVDSGLKYIRNIRITMPYKPANSTQFIDVTFDYTGGKTLPITIAITSKDAKNDNTIHLGLTLHKDAAKTDISIAAKGTFNYQKIDLSSSMLIESTNDEIKVLTPANSKNIMELLGGLFGGSSTVQPASLLKSLSL